MSDKKLKIIFMGSPDFACPTLRLLSERHEVLHVLTQPPRASGRGMAEKKTPVAQLAETLGITVSWPTSLKTDEAQQMLASFGADIFVVVAYGLILPKAILELPRLGCLNGHASLLPRWRGAAPIQRAIEAGDSKTGICAMMMEEGLDTGPVIHHSTTDITDEDTALSLHDRLAEMTANCLVEAVALLAHGNAKPVIQPEEGVCYAAKISKAEARMDLGQSAAHLKRQIHAFSPFPGAFIEGASGKRLKCLSASLYPQTKTAAAGTYLGMGDDGGLLIVCAEHSVLSIKTLQPAGKKPMEAEAFLRGRQLVEGAPLAAQI